MISSSVFSSFSFIFERERDRDRDRERAGRGRERDAHTESQAGSRLGAVSTDPDAGLELTCHW